MSKSNLTPADIQLLDGIAMNLLFAGKDFAADAIFAAIYPEDDDSTGGTWEDVFAG